MGAGMATATMRFGCKTRAKHQDLRVWNDLQLQLALLQEYIDFPTLRGQT